MTEALRDAVNQIYADLHFVVEKNPNASVGNATRTILRTLLTKAKDSGGDPKMCDMLINDLTDTRMTATDAYNIAGHLMTIVTG